MPRVFRLAPAALLVAVALVPAQAPKDTPPQKGEYVKRDTRAATVGATLASFGLPNLGGKWLYAGPFDNPGRQAFKTAYPPEVNQDPAATFVGKGGQAFGWRPLPNFQPGAVYNLARLFPTDRANAVVYLLHEIDAPQPFKLPLSFGADDTLTVWVNGKRLVHEDHERPAAADQYRAEAELTQGKNTLLLKVCQYGGGWEVYAAPELPALVPESIHRRAERDFPPPAMMKSIAAAAGKEDKHYKVTTLPLPEDCVLEAGGLAFRPDGKLLACTRRGDIWLVHNPLAEPSQVKMTRFATGLHEALGLHVEDDNTVYVVQRPELTRVTDRDGDGVADEFATVCDKWGVSGDYHEYAFGPARDRDGNFFVTLNVGFSGGHQAKAPWRGWCVKIDPKTGRMEPWAYGLRSPNGVTFSPDGELFYADNQGEWAATNKLAHIKRGKFYGHQAGLRWVKDSPFAGLVPDKVAFGMRYDGERGPAAGAPDGFPEVDPPAVWFPYGRMGNSLSEPKWDTTAGKFGPFAGQCFVGDQTKSTVMRVALETVNGVHQGACFPFRSGLQCGVNRLVFAPDGSLFVGETRRGWGSMGTVDYGLQRVAYTGVLPFDIHHVALTKVGFDLAFTKPLNPATVAKPGCVSVGSFTYVYQSTYGCPETDRRAETVESVTLSPDEQTLSFAVPTLRRGRVYEVRLDGVAAADGDELLHPEAYYTLNELVK